MVLANPEIAKLPNWVMALVAAGGLAAALSTAVSFFPAIIMGIFYIMKFKFDFFGGGRQQIGGSEFLPKVLL